MAESIYFSAGYIITKIFPRPTAFKKMLFRSRAMISMCDCLAEPPINHWFQDVNDYSDPPANPSEFTDWVYQEYQKTIGLNNIFYSLAGARAFLQRFYPDREDLVILNWGLRQDLVSEFLRETYYEDPYSAESGGIYHMLQQAEPVDTITGNILGFELIGFDTTHPHSWLCKAENHRFVTTRSPHNLKPNRWGLLRSFEAAMEISPHVFFSNFVERFYPWIVVHFSRKPKI